MKRVAAIGEAMIELSMQGNTAKVGVAGDTLNTAVYLKRADTSLQVDYVTCLGDDPFSDKIEVFIAAQGINTEEITRFPGLSPGLYAITTSDTGERSFTYWRDSSAARHLFEVRGTYDFERLSRYDLIYLSGISVAILPQAARLALLQWLAQSSVLLAYDSNYRPRLWESRTIAKEITEAFWARADICLPSVDDEMELFGCSAQDVIERFRGSTGALKRGADGPLSLGSDITQFYPPADSVVDTTAAGDSFNGAYLAAFLQGKSQRHALLAGHKCAAHVVGFHGAIIPRKEI